MHEHVAVTFIEDLGVRIEHEALVVGVRVARDREAPASVAHEHEEGRVGQTYRLLRDVLLAPL